MKRKASTVAALTGSIVALAAPAAVATSFSGSETGARAAGVVSIDARAIVTGTVWDTRYDGSCARLQGNFDIPLAPDHDFDVAKACGVGTSAYGYGDAKYRGDARDFEVRVRTDDGYKVIWQGDTHDA